MSHLRSEVEKFLAAQKEEVEAFGRALVAEPDRGGALFAAGNLEKSLSRCRPCRCRGRRDDGRPSRRWPRPAARWR